MSKKIICIPTIGQYENFEIYEKLIANYVKNGIDMVRINCTRFSINQYKEIIQIYRKIFKTHKVDVKILLDLPCPGSKTRISFSSGVREQEIKCKEDYILKLKQDDARKVVDNTILVDNEELMERAIVNDYIMAADGEIVFKVVDVRENMIYLTALNSGVLRFGKALYTKNCIYKRNDIEKQILLYKNFIREVSPYGIILSFLEESSDIKRFKVLFPDIKIIPKIETPLGMKNIDRILEDVSIIMFGRGDLGNICIEKLGYYQEIILKKCKPKNIQVIVATGVLNSISKGMPVIDRAEAIDGYLLVKQGVDYVVASNPISKNEKFMDRFVKFWEKLYIEEHDNKY